MINPWQGAGCCVQGMANTGSSHRMCFVFFGIIVYFGTYTEYCLIKDSLCLSPSFFLPFLLPTFLLSPSLFFFLFPIIHSPLFYSLPSFLLSFLPYFFFSLPRCLFLSFSFLLCPFPLTHPLAPSL